MSAPGEDTFTEEVGEEMDEAGSDDEEEMQEEGEDGERERKVYVPGIEPLQPGEELEMDRTAYRMYHECQTGKLLSAKLAHIGAKLLRESVKCEFVFRCLCSGAPCLSFDVLRDGDGDDREQFPLSMLLCAGTQADTALSNRSVTTHLSNLPTFQIRHTHFPLLLDA